MPMRTTLFSLLLGGALTGCASSMNEPRAPQAPASEAVVPAKPPAQVSTQTNVISSSGEEGTAAELFEKGKQALLQEKYAEAARLFDLVLQGDPESKLAAAATLQAGMAYEGASNRETALARYRQVIDKYGSGELAKTAMLRSGRVLTHLERWSDLAAMGDALVARSDLTNSETLEALGDRALGLVEGGETEQSSRLVEKARTLMEKHHIGEAGRIPDEVALVFFTLGEVRRLKSEATKFDPLPAAFGEVFEARATGLLDAQAAYTDAMRTTDAFWATWAGYRVGRLYQQLHDDVMVIKIPDKIQKVEKDRKLFEGAMQLRYRVLLEKGLKMMTSTVKMNDRVGETNAWGQRAREAQAQIEREIAAANAAIKKVGVPEETLKKALDDLAKKKP
jgi:tetratricopeptide (TPR) repeat protein